MEYSERYKHRKLQSLNKRTCELREEYRYQDIILRDIDQSTSGASKLLENVRQLEENFKVQMKYSDGRDGYFSESKKSNYGKARREIRHIIHMRGKVNRGLRISNGTSCENNMKVTCTTNGDQSRGVQCEVLGPVLCKKCYADRKVRTKRDEVGKVLNTFDIEDYETQREKALFTVLSIQKSKEQFFEPLKLHQINLSDQLKDGYIARYNTPIPSSLLQSKSAHRENTLYSTLPLRKSIKLATNIMTEIEKNQEKNTQLENTDKVQRVESVEKNIHSDEFSEHDVSTASDTARERKLNNAPPNSNSTPKYKHPVYRPPPSRPAVKSSGQPRTDLEWFHEISQRRHDNTRQGGVMKNKQNKRNIDVLLLATKLSEIFKQRYLPPDRNTASRTSSVSSVDFNLEHQKRISTPEDPRRYKSISEETEPNFIKNEVSELHEKSNEELWNIQMDNQSTENKTPDSSKDSEKTTINPSWKKQPLELPIINMELVRARMLQESDFKKKKE